MRCERAQSANAGGGVNTSFLRCEWRASDPTAAAIVSPQPSPSTFFTHFTMHAIKLTADDGLPLGGSRAIGSFADGSVGCAHGWRRCFWFCRRRRFLLLRGLLRCARVLLLALVLREGIASETARLAHAANERASDGRRVRPARRLARP